MFADNLKRDLPRIPFAPDFWAFASAGKELAEWHLNYESLVPYELSCVESPGVPLRTVREGVAGGCSITAHCTARIIA